MPGVRRPSACSLVFFLAAACISRNPSFVRLAVIPPENLTSDPSLDWIGLATGAILVDQSSGSKTTSTFLASSTSDALARRAGRVLRGYFTGTAKDLRLQVAIEDLQTHRVTQTIASAGEVLQIASNLLKTLGLSATPFGSGNAESIKHYGLALLAANPDQRASSFERAIAADPKFGAAYVGWMELLLSRGDRSGAIRAEELGRANRGGFSPLDGARFDYAAASLNGDQPAQIQALGTLAGLVPTDPRTVEAMARLALGQRKFQTAVSYFETAALLEPDNAILLNPLAYAQALARDLAGAKRTLEANRRLAPADTNVIDSLGEVHFFLGHFAEAEKYFLEASTKTPAELLKAAEARLMTGDRSHADELFHRYAEFRKTGHDPLAIFVETQWDFLAGRRGKAITDLRAFASGAAPDLASYAYSQLCIWNLQLGDRTRASESAARAGSSNSSGVCQFLLQPPASPSEWAVRAERSYPEPAQARIKKTLLGYALVLNREFREAALVWKELYDGANPLSDAEARLMLAWSLAETGAVRSTEPLLAMTPIPQVSGDSLFASFTFPRIFELREKLSEALGNQQEAERNHKLFAQFNQ